MQVNAPKRVLRNSGTLPTNRVVLKGSDGQNIEKKQPLAMAGIKKTPAQLEAEAKAKAEAAAAA
ncbi:MAG: hypothetical protein Q4F30_09540, partial [Akkermansia sp.]|nr:hypothetical protein [Akkermansia sp.]